MAPAAEEAPGLTEGVDSRSRRGRRPEQEELQEKPVPAHTRVGCAAAETSREL